MPNQQGLGSGNICSNNAKAPYNPSKFFQSSSISMGKTTDKKYRKTQFKEVSECKCILKSNVVEDLKCTENIIIPNENTDEELVFRISLHPISPDTKTVDILLNEYQKGNNKKKNKEKSTNLSKKYKKCPSLDQKIHKDANKKNCNSNIIVLFSDNDDDNKMYCF